MQHKQDLRPEKFTLKEIDNELHSMALIRSLPNEYKSLLQSLMLYNDLNKTKIREAFLAEETKSQRRGEQSIAGMSEIALARSDNSKTELECDFCSIKGHTSQTCWKLVSACNYARRPHPPRKQTANTANNETEAPNVIESAGNASLCHISSSLLQIDANFDWNADSGATSHMMPHVHWIRNYTPFWMPIHLANNDIVYSAGIGSVRFIPMTCGSGPLLAHGSYESKLKSVLIIPNIYIIYLYR